MMMMLGKSVFAYVVGLKWILGQRIRSSFIRFWLFLLVKLIKGLSSEISFLNCHGREVSIKSEVSLKKC
jgi:hypothetical protein